MDENCKNTKYLITPVTGIPGPAGPQGPAGPPGSAISLPITADDVTVTNVGFTTVQDVLDYLLYVAPEILSFTTPTTVYEIGLTVNSLTFNWSLNQDPVTQTITGPNIAVPPVLVPTDRSVIVSLTGISGATPGDSFTYTLDITDNITPDSANRAVSFLNGLYYGDAVLPGAIDSTFLLTLTRSLQNNWNKSYTSSAGAGEYTWIAHRTALGTPTITAGGFLGGFEAPVTISFTNAAGYTEDYYVYRSTNSNIGPVLIEVS